MNGAIFVRFRETDHFCIGSASVFYCTPLKTNTSPENQWLEDVFPIEMVPFWGTC